MPVLVVLRIFSLRNKELRASRRHSRGATALGSAGSTMARRYVAPAMLAHPRQAFRYHPLDGAALHFQPATGVHLRVETPATRPLRRHAPRVAMFGITNACNRACEFCSRDVTRPS